MRQFQSFAEFVALYTSAWIEISVLLAYRWKYIVALYTSAWIEILYLLLYLLRDASRTLHECVD